MDIKQIEAILKLMKEYGADALKIQADDLKISVNMTPRAGAQVVSTTPQAVPVVYEKQGSEDISLAQSLEQAVLSPTVGIFYTSPGPEEPPFVNIGDHVSPETILCIIESMKVMNEIPAGVSGTVTEILPVNGDRVEFEQKLMTVRADS